MNMNREQQFKRELTEELRNNILPFWARQMVDPGGGFFGRMTGTGELIANAGRSAILCGRILWTFSAAYRTSGCEQYLATATAARDYLLDKFLDKTYGGVYWSVDAAGNPADTKKQFYALGFAIYGRANTPGRQATSGRFGRQSDSSGLSKSTPTTPLTTAMKRRRPATGHRSTTCA